MDYKYPLIDYLAVGHVSDDIVIKGDVELRTTGGTVAFSSEVAHALGLRAAVLTSSAPSFDLAAALPNSIVVNVPSAETTTFSNIYYPEGRKQVVHALADWVSAESLPPQWADTRIAHLGPITTQIDPNLVLAFSEQTLIGITPQGWMRRWGDDGEVHAIRMMATDILLPNATATVIGQEDLLDDAQLVQMRELSKLLVMTRNAKGCVVFEGDNVYHIPAPKVIEDNPTGAGDIFATAFFIKLQQTGGNSVEAAKFANLVAATSVAEPDLTAKVAAIKLLTNN